MSSTLSLAEREARARAKLSGVLLSTAPTSHMLSHDDATYSRDVNIPPIGAALKAGSNLRTTERDSLLDVLARQSHDASSLQTSLQFMSHDVLSGPRRGPVDALTATLKAGSGTLERALAVDASVRSLPPSTAVPSRVGRDTVAALLAVTGSSGPLSSEYGRASEYTPAMAACVAGRDMRHALKADEDRRYNEEKVKFDRMLGGPKGSSSRKTAAAT